MDGWLQIGELARRTGLTHRTLRHYDDLGLVVPSGRTGGDYRQYSPDDVRRLLAVQQLKSLGLSLGEIRAALDDPAFDAADASWTTSTITARGGLVYDDTTRERLRSFIGYATARLADHMRHTEPLPDGTPDYSTFSTRYAEPPPPAWARKLNRARKRLDAPWADQ